MVLIGIGYRAPQQSAGVATTAPIVANGVTSTDTQPTVNSVVAANIAANVASATNLSVAPNVANLAVSTQIESELPQSGGDSISKPQIIQLSAASRNITTYTVQAGDTVDSVAARFGLTADTIKWANNLTSNILTAGASLQILPRDGIVYTAKAGDTIASIATKYKADASLITVYNDLEISGITAGLKLVIPGGILPANERPGYAAPVTAYAVGYGSGFSGNTWFIKRGTPMYAGNTYARGYCTAYAYDRRVELGLPVAARWGNAATWAREAQKAGYRVDRTPSVGAIIQNGGGLGHVAIVEEILANGDLRLSEMNAAVSGGGWNIVSGRTLSAAYVGQYLYIH